MWTKNANQANGKVDWEEALAKSASCNDGGHTDWRLPNRNELTSLIDLDQAQPALTNGHPFNTAIRGMEGLRSTNTIELPRPVTRKASSG
jgi:hypothetical protein